MIAAANIFDAMPAGAACEDEQVMPVLTRPGVQIERIVSAGRASPPGFWYDQAWDEWVIVLAGSARLRFEDEAGARQFGPGDYVLIPAHARHRIDWTSPDQPTVWLAMHFRDEPGTTS